MLDENKALADQKAIQARHREACAKRCATCHPSALRRLRGPSYHMAPFALRLHWASGSEAPGVARACALDGELRFAYPHSRWTSPSAPVLPHGDTPMKNQAERSVSGAVKGHCLPGTFFGCRYDWRVADYKFGSLKLGVAGVVLIF